MKITTLSTMKPWQTELNSQQLFTAISGSPTLTLPETVKVLPDACRLPEPITAMSVSAEITTKLMTTSMPIPELSLLKISVLTIPTA